MSKRRNHNTSVVAKRNISDPDGKPQSDKRSADQQQPPVGRREDRSGHMRQDRHQMSEHGKDRTKKHTSEDDAVGESTRDGQDR